MRHEAYLTGEIDHCTRSKFKSDLKPLNEGVGRPTVETFVCKGG